VTLMVTPEQALALSYGEYTSNLRLVLRSPLDTQETQTPAVKNQDFMN
jgi:Flp pilus assembly protein CpaB